MQRRDVDVKSLKEISVKDSEGVWFGVAAENESIFATTFSSSEKMALDDLKRNLPPHTQFEIRKEPSTFAYRVIEAMKDVYDGKGTSEEFTFSTRHLSEYSRRVIEAVLSIPVGYVASYGEVAKAVGGSPRAVGRVMATNPFAPLCACHRIVSSDFTLGGYGGGLKLKLAMLRREKRGYSSRRQIRIEGKNLIIFPVEFALNKLEQRKT